MVTSTWFNYYSFNVLGDLAFGKSFDMLSSGRAHFAMELLQSGMLPLGLLTPISWMKAAGPRAEQNQNDVGAGNRSTNHKRSGEKEKCWRSISGRMMMWCKGRYRFGFFCSWESSSQHGTDRRDSL